MMKCFNKINSPKCRRIKRGVAVALLLAIASLLPQVMPATARAEMKSIIAAPPTPPPVTQAVAGDGHDLWVLQTIKTEQQFVLLHRDESTPPNVIYRVTQPPLVGLLMDSKVGGRAVSPIAAQADRLYVIYSDWSVQSMRLEQVQPAGQELLNVTQLPPLLPRGGQLIDWVAGHSGPVALVRDKPPAPAPPAAPATPAPSPAAKPPTPAPTDKKPADPAASNVQAEAQLPADEPAVIAKATPAQSQVPFQIYEFRSGTWRIIDWPDALPDVTTAPRLVMLNSKSQQIALLVEDSVSGTTHVYTRQADRWTDESYNLDLSGVAQILGVAAGAGPGEMSAAYLYVVQPATDGEHLGLSWLRNGQAAQPKLISIPGRSRWWASPGVDRITVVSSDTAGKLMWMQPSISGAKDEPLASLESRDSPLGVSDPFTLAFVAATIVGMIFMFLSARRDAVSRVPRLPATVETAGLFRIVAAIVDITPPIGVAALVFPQQTPMEMLRHWPNGLAADWEAAKPIALVIALHVAHTMICELFTGATLGKLVMACRVVNLTGGPPHIWQVFIRNFFKGIELLAPPLLILAMLSPTRQRLGDLVAGTLVVTPKPPKTERDPLDDLDDLP